MTDAVHIDVDDKTVDVTDDAMETTYKIVKDEYTGDWHVHSEGDELLQGHWLQSRDDAITFVLNWLDVLDNGDYQMAPERC